LFLLAKRPSPTVEISVIIALDKSEQASRAVHAVFLD
jgi:hypothetical protein